MDLGGNYSRFLRQGKPQNMGKQTAIIKNGTKSVAAWPFRAKLKGRTPQASLEPLGHLTASKTQKTQKNTHMKFRVFGPGPGLWTRGLAPRLGTVGQPLKATYTVLREFVNELTSS